MWTITPEFYEPEVWRGRPEGSIKQGSGTQEVRLKPPVGTDFDGKSFEYEDLWGDCDNGWAIPLHNSKHHYDAVEWYKWLLESGVAPEMARMVLPQSMYTEAWGTFSLAALARFYKLRADSHAQLRRSKSSPTLSTASFARCSRCLGRLSQIRSRMVINRAILFGEADGLADPEVCSSTTNWGLNMQGIQSRQAIELSTVPVLA
jgi:hypothetical protein